MVSHHENNAYAFFIHDARKGFILHPMQTKN